MWYAKHESIYTQGYHLILYIGKITGAPWCLGTIPNTYKIHHVLYIPQGMCDLYIPNPSVPKYKMSLSLTLCIKNSRYVLVCRLKAK
jgi:hypothetical protein